MAVSSKLKSPFDLFSGAAGAAAKGAGAAATGA
jgi:hypothetical protein